MSRKGQKDQEWSPRRLGFWTESEEALEARYESLEDPFEQWRLTFDAMCRQLRGERMYESPVESAAISLKEANDFLQREHRHSGTVVGWKFGVGVRDHLSLVGIAVVGRPVSRVLDDGQTLEVTRVCTLTGQVQNVVSQLLGRCARIARDMGYTKLVSYTLADEEEGTSYRAAGWEPVRRSEGGSWDRSERQRSQRPEQEGPKIRWEKSLRT